MKPFLIGESNPYGGHEEFALYPEPKGCTGWRLCHLVLKMDPDVYCEAFERRNLLIGKWSAPRAREAAAKLLDEARGAPMVLLGSKVCAAFGEPFQPFHEVIGPDRRLVILPHPSGLCRLWHEKGAFERAREVLRRAGVLPVEKEVRHAG